MRGKVCIVTGANAGIGYEIAKALAELDAHVVLVSRNELKGREARDSIKAVAGDSNVELVVGDLGSIASTRTLAEAIANRYPKIHVLVNNAGVWMTQRELNEDGLERSFMTNHLAPFMLSQLLLPNLMAASPARIVTVNSGLYVKGKVDIQRTPTGEDFGRLASYANSKLCNVLTLEEQARQLEGTGVTINMVHPGVIRSNLGETTGIVGWLLRQVKRLWKTPEQGAEAPVWLATDPSVSHHSGVYFNEKKIMPLVAVAQDRDLADAVWAQAQALCFPEKESSVA